MYVHQVMSEKPLSLQPSNTIEDALRLMEDNDIREIPITSGKAVKGIFTDRDIKMHLGPAVARLDETQMDVQVLHTPLAQVMTQEVQMVSAHTPLSTVCRLFQDLKVGSLLVQDDARHLVGLISVTDVLSAAAPLFQGLE